MRTRQRRAAAFNALAGAPIVALRSSAQQQRAASSAARSGACRAGGEEHGGEKRNGLAARLRWCSPDPCAPAMGRCKRRRKVRGRRSEHAPPNGPDAACRKRRRAERRRRALPMFVLPLPSRTWGLAASVGVLCHATARATWFDGLRVPALGDLLTTGCSPNERTPRCSGVFLSPSVVTARAALRAPFVVFVLLAPRFLAFLREVEVSRGALV